MNDTKKMTGGGGCKVLTDGMSTTRKVHTIGVIEDTTFDALETADGDVRSAILGGITATASPFPITTEMRFQKVSHEKNRPFTRVSVTTGEIIVYFV